jgi:hypothetical protein
LDSGINFIRHAKEAAGFAVHNPVMFWGCDDEIIRFVAALLFIVVVDMIGQLTTRAWPQRPIKKALGDQSMFISVASDVGERMIFADSNEDVAAWIHHAAATPVWII